MEATFKPSSDGTKIFANWTPVAGCDGYGFFVDGVRVSRTLDPARSSATFGVPDSKDHHYEIKPLHLSFDSGASFWFPNAPTPPVGVNVTPPQPPFTLMDGGKAKDSAVFSRDTGSPEIAHLDVKNYLGYGVGQMAWSGGPVKSTGTSKIHDIRVENISANPPRSRNGTAESGYWFGQRTNAYNFFARNCSWMNMWTGADCKGSVFHDFEIIDAPLVSLYCEHETWDSKFYNFYAAKLDKDKGGVGGNVINIEWWYGGKGSKRLSFDNFEIYVPAGSWAYFGDAGTCGVEIAATYGKIWGPGNGIIMPNKLADLSLPNKIHLENIDFSGLKGTKYATHNNAMGATFDDHKKAVAAGELHPDTFRMPRDFSSRMAEMATLL